MLLQGVQTTPVFRECSALPGHNDQIQPSQHRLVMSEAFANHTLDTISVYRSATVFFRDGQTQTCIAVSVRSGQYQKVSIAGTLTVVKNPAILVGFQQSTTARKDPFRFWQ